MVKLVTLTASLLTLALGCHAGGPIIHLGYATYQGSTLPGNVDQFLGVRYAQPPLGELRFRAPLPPRRQRGIQDATKYGDACLQIGLQIGSSGGVGVQQKKLPVMYWIYGGGFVNGECSWSSFNGTELVKISGGRVIVVTINYRLNAFGFLSPAQVKAGGNLNVGSLDQRAGLQWVRQHALQFGGDPSRVTAFGESAGAISIGYQMIANNGDQRLFHQAMLFSGSALTFRCASYLLYQPTHDAITNITGCASSPDSLQCLRQVNATTLLAVASKVYNSAVSNFYPVVDGTFISETCSALLTSDRFSKIPIIIGTNTNEGTKFVTQYNFTNSEQLASGLIEEDMPGLTNSSLQTILELYPEQSNPPGAPYPEFARAANIIGDYMFICPAYTTAHDYQQFVPVYKYRFNVVADPTLGAFHTADLPFDFDQNALENFTRPVATLADTISSYYTSFAATGNPNTFRHPGSIEWPVYSQATGYQQIVY